MAIPRPIEFTAKIKECSLRKIRGVCLKEMDYLRASYNGIANVKTAITKYRTMLNQEIDDEKIIDRCKLYLRLTDDETRFLKQQHREQVSADQLNLKVIHDYDAHIQRGIGLLDHASYIDRILGLAVLTGRRPAEIACSAVFTLIPGNDGHLLFSGQLKTKRRDNLAPYKIPVFHDPEKLIVALKELQRDKGEFWNDTKKFHDLASGRLSKRCKKILQPVIDNRIAVHNLRGIYACIAYMYLDRATITEQKYYGIILGHEEHDNVTAGSYMDFCIEE